MQQMSQVLRECAIGMLIAGMSTRAVARKSNVHFYTISRLNIILENLANRPHNHRPLVPTPWDHVRPATCTPDKTVSLRNRRISTQTVRNHLREAQLRAHHPHQGLDLTAVRRRN